MSVNPFEIKTVLLAKHAQHVVLVHFPIALFVAAVCAAADGPESIRLRCYRALPAGGAAPLLCKTLALSEGWDVF